MSRRFQFSLGTLFTLTLAIGLFLLPLSQAVSAPPEAWAVMGPISIVCLAFGMVVLCLWMIQK